MKNAMQFMLNDMYRRMRKDFFKYKLPLLPVYVTHDKPYLACCYAVDQRPAYIYVCLERAEVSHVEEIRVALLHEMVTAYCLLHNIPLRTSTGEPTQAYINTAKAHGLYYDRGGH